MRARMPQELVDRAGIDHQRSIGERESRGVGASVRHDDEERCLTRSANEVALERTAPTMSTRLFGGSLKAPREWSFGAWSAMGATDIFHSRATSRQAS